MVLILKICVIFRQLLTTISSRSGICLNVPFIQKEAITLVNHALMATNPWKNFALHVCKLNFAVGVADNSSQQALLSWGGMLWGPQDSSYPAVFASANLMGSSSVTAKSSDSSAASMPDLPFVLWWNPGLSSTNSPPAPRGSEAMTPLSQGAWLARQHRHHPESCWPVPPPASKLCHPQPP